MTAPISGKRWEVDIRSELYPDLLREISNPPKKLYCIGNAVNFEPGLAVIGARNATPYGIGCAKRFAGVAAESGIPIVSGGARGCDGAAHQAAIDSKGATYAVLGGGCDCLYPANHRPLFQSIVDSGGLVVSEYEWDVKPRPFMFRERNRIIAGLSRATLVVEAGLPSGTFSTADEALDAGREVWAVPGSIVSPTSAGANQLILQGATPVIDDHSFREALFCTFAACVPVVELSADPLSLFASPYREIVAAAIAAPQSMDALMEYGVELGLRESEFGTLLAELTRAEELGLLKGYPGGKVGCA